MRKKNFLITVTFIAVTFFMFSCSTKKAVSIAKQEGAVELSIPFSVKEFKSDSKFFREVGQGKSSDMPTAKKIAMTNALTTLATRIQNTTKAVTDQYTNQRNVTQAEEFEKKYEEMARICR